MNTADCGEIFDSMADVDAVVTALLKGSTDATKREMYTDMVIEKIHAFDDGSEEFYDKLLEVQGKAMEFESSNSVAAQSRGLEAFAAAQELVTQLHAPAALLASGGNEAHREAVKVMQEHLDEAAGKLEGSRVGSSSGGTGCGSVLLALATVLVFGSTLLRLSDEPPHRFAQYGIFRYAILALPWGKDYTAIPDIKEILCHPNQIQLKAAAVAFAANETAPAPSATGIPRAI